MSTRFFCDRCGGELLDSGPRGTQCSVVAMAHNVAPGSTLQVEYYHDTSSTQWTRLASRSDLCSRCVDAFMRWLKTLPASPREE
jgi:hypothetical protein